MNITEDLHEYRVASDGETLSDCNEILSELDRMGRKRLTELTIGARERNLLRRLLLTEQAHLRSRR